MWFLDYMNKLKNSYERVLNKLLNFFTIKLNNYLSFFIFIFIVLSILFARPFVGLYIFDIRIGELAIAGLFFLSFLTLFIPKSIFPYDLSKLSQLFKLAIAFFMVSLLISSSSILSPYTFRTSSYIWTFLMLFIGYAVVSDNDFSVLLKNFIILIPIFTYIISTGNYPNIIIDFFNKYSDKFQFIKAADLAIGLYISVLIINKHFKSKTVAFNLSLIVCSIFIPLMLFNSRGSFFSILIFIAFYLFQNQQFILKNKLNFIIVLIISSACFFASTLRVYGNLDFYKEPDAVTSEVVVESLKGITGNKQPAKVFLSFYIQDGYLMSWDPTTDWRLDIWQDVLYDLIEKNQILTGYGYKDIIPVMLDPTAPGRLGRDGLNENVHNYFVNILARGGILQLLLFLYIYKTILTVYKRNHGDYKILILLIPILILSSLDVTMEGVNFPIIFYTYLGYTIKKGI